MFSLPTVPVELISLEPSPLFGAVALGQSSGSGTTGELVVSLIVVVGLVIASSVVALKLRHNAKNGPGSAGGMTIMQQLKKMQAEGLISDEEFSRVRRSALKQATGGDIPGGQTQAGLEVSVLASAGAAGGTGGGAAGAGGGSPLADPSASTATEPAAGAEASADPEERRAPPGYDLLGRPLPKAEGNA